MPNSLIWSSKDMPNSFDAIQSNLSDIIMGEKVLKFKKIWKGSVISNNRQEPVKSHVIARSN